MKLAYPTFFSLLLLTALILPVTHAPAERLGSPVQTGAQRDGRVLGSPHGLIGGGDTIRGIQRGPALPSPVSKAPVATAPRQTIQASEIPAPPLVASNHQAPEPIAIVGEAKTEKIDPIRDMVHEPTRRATTKAPPKQVPAPKAEKAETRITPTAHPSWLNTYRLGPGDVLNFSLYLRPELSRLNVSIAPDGTVSYLQAISIPADGRTIDQLKWAMEHNLSEYHNDPQVIITPAVIGSKQFSIIGRVREPGSYALDRPVTVLEGMAMAKGIEVGTIDGNQSEIADMKHSFVARNGHKLGIDLAKLYYEGDFSQNAYLEPNDYIYVASSLNQEYYILGYVANPGRKRIATTTTVARAVADADGYEDGAWKKQVVLVRGSIHSPEKYIVDLKAIIKGKAPDVEIESGDIIYVRERPTRLLEEAVDEAIFTFVQTATAEAINEELSTNIDAGQDSGDDN